MLICGHDVSTQILLWLLLKVIRKSNYIDDKAKRKMFKSVPLFSVDCRVELLRNLYTDTCIREMVLVQCNGATSKL